MIIVVAVVGILAAISATALRLMIPRWQLQDAGTGLDTLIKRSKLISARDQLPLTIRFEDDSETPIAVAAMTRGQVYTLVARDPANNAVAKMPLYALASGVEIDANTFAGEQIRFDVFGQVESTGEIIFGYDMDAARRRVLTVSIDTLDGLSEIEESTI